MCGVLGVQLSAKKFLRPAVICKALGFIFNMRAQTVAVPQPKLDKAFRCIQQMLHDGAAARKQLERLVGLLQWFAPILFPSRVMLRALIDQLVQCPALSGSTVELTIDAKQALLWWLHWAQSLNACPFDAVLGIFPGDTVSVFTDASDWGIGAWAPPLFFACAFVDMPARWRYMQFEDIAVREIFAVAVALFSWRRCFAGQKLRLCLDNTTAHAALKKLSSRNRSVMHFVRFIALLALQDQFRWFNHWLASAANATADALSRNRMTDFQILTFGKETQESPARFCDFLFVDVGHV